MAKGIRTSDGEEQSFDKYIEKQTMHDDIYTSLLKAILPHKERPAEPNKYSVGEIVDCLKRSYYERVIGHYETLEDLTRSALGKAAHYSLLRYYDIKEKEKEISFDYMGEKLSVVGKLLN